MEHCLKRKKEVPVKNPNCEKGDVYFFKGAQCWDLSIVLKDGYELDFAYYIHSNRLSFTVNCFLDEPLFFKVKDNMRELR